ncbi:MAG: hypothetical protein U0893_03520 [Chloroflexota bacterium]
MPNWQQVNARKINKVVSILLGRYHRSHGLAVVGVGRPIGTCHLYLYSLAVRGKDGEPLFLPDFTKRYFLGIYQGVVGLPLWVGDRDLIHPEHDRRELRTIELVNWFEEQLTLRPFFTDHAEQIGWWRRTYHVAQSEPYLLTWEIMGRVAGAMDAPIEAYGRYDSYGDTPAETAAISRHGSSPSEMVHRVGDLAFAYDGSAHLPDGTRFDLWEKHVRGEAPQQIVAELRLQADAVRNRNDHAHGG